MQLQHTDFSSAVVLAKSMTNLAISDHSDLQAKVNQLERELEIVSQESKDLQDQIMSKEKDLDKKART